MSLFTSVNTTVQDINQIHEMFPTTDKEVIKTVLTANAGNKVSGSDCHPTYRPGHISTNHGTGEVLCCCLYHVILCVGVKTYTISSFVDMLVEI